MLGFAAMLLFAAMSREFENIHTTPSLFDVKMDGPNSPDSKNSAEGSPPASNGHEADREVEDVRNEVEEAFNEVAEVQRQMTPLMEITRADASSQEEFADKLLKKATQVLKTKQQNPVMLLTIESMYSNRSWLGSFLVWYFNFSQCCLERYVSPWVGVLFMVNEFLEHSSWSISIDVLCMSIVLIIQSTTLFIEYQTLEGKPQVRTMSNVISVVVVCLSWEVGRGEGFNLIGPMRPVLLFSSLQSMVATLHLFATCVYEIRSVVAFVFASVVVLAAMVRKLYEGLLDNQAATCNNFLDSFVAVYTFLESLVL